MTDRDVVEEFFRVVECGRISPEKLRSPPLKSFYVWTVGNLADAERILLAFMPRLGSRRKEKALAALEEIKRHRAALIRTCDSCGAEFEAKRDVVGRFCSTPCYMRTYYAKHRGVRAADRAVSHA